MKTTELIARAAAKDKGVRFDEAEFDRIFERGKGGRAVETGAHFDLVHRARKNSNNKKS